MAHTSKLHISSHIQTCKDAAFCDRLRGVRGPAVHIDPASVSVSGAHVAASIVNPAAPNATLSLRLLSLGSTVRLHVTELSSLRYEVPGILLPSVSDMLEVGPGYYVWAGSSNMKWKNMVSICNMLTDANDRSTIAAGVEGLADER